MEPEFWILVTKYLSNEASEKDINNLFLLLENDEKCQNTFDEIVIKWNAIGKIKPETFHPDKAKQLLLAKIKDENKSRYSFSKLITAPLMAIATTLLILLGSYVFFSTELDKNFNWTEFKTAKNEKLKIVLPDSTLVWLNKNATISYNFSKQNKRLIKLNGEAFFKVKRDEQRPFIIESKYFTTQVLGTSFNINSNENETASVSVVSGKVAVTTLETEELMLLERGHKAIFDEISNTMLKKQLSDIENEMAWVDKNFVFKDTPLETALGYLSKNYSWNFKVTNENLKNCLITGNFNNESLKSILTVICTSLDCEFKKGTQNTIILSGNGCEKKPEDIDPTSGQKSVTNF